MDCECCRAHSQRQWWWCFLKNPSRVVLPPCHFHTARPCLPYFACNYAILPYSHLSDSILLYARLLGHIGSSVPKYFPNWAAHENGVVLPITVLTQQLLLLILNSAQQFIQMGYQVAQIQNPKCFATWWIYKIVACTHACMRTGKRAWVLCGYLNAMASVTLHLFQ